MVSDRPKVLASLAGRPFLAYLLDQLAAQGLRQATLCTGYLGDQIEAHFGTRYQGIELSYSHEDYPLGTAGALRRALPHLASSTVLVLNGDSYCEVDLESSLRWHQDKKALTTLVLARVENCARFGLVESTIDGRIRGFREKTGHPTAGWINSGIYWFERAVLSALRADKPLSLERDVLASWSGPGLFGYQQPGRFLDIGVPEDYARAERFLAATPSLAALAG
jgi:D-glycero-alpha-D-manno-heptose 1-phosphate guanylyltransferase